MGTSHVVVTAAGALTLALAAYVIVQESAANFRGDSALARVAATPDSEAPIGLSTATQRSALLDCERLFRTAGSPAMTELPDGERLHILTVCADQSAAIASQNPLNSFAWTVAAAGWAWQNNPLEFNSAMAKASLTGRNESWIAEVRVGLAERSSAMLDAQGRARQQEDIATVLQSNRQVTRLARRYLASDQDFRSRVSQALEQVPPTAQRSFLRAVDRLLQAGQTIP